MLPCRFSSDVTSTKNEQMSDDELFSSDLATGRLPRTLKSDKIIRSMSAGDKIENDFDMKMRNQQCFK